MEHVRFSPAAELSLKALPASDRERVRRVLRQVRRSPHDERNRRLLKRVDASGQLYSLNVTDQLRAVIRFGASGATVLEIVSKDRLSSIYHLPY